MRLGRLRMRQTLFFSVMTAISLPPYSEQLQPIPGRYSIEYQTLPACEMSRPHFVSCALMTCTYSSRSLPDRACRPQLFLQTPAGYHESLLVLLTSMPVILDLFPNRLLWLCHYCLFPTETSVNTVSVQIVTNTAVNDLCSAHNDTQNISSSHILLPNS